MNYLSCYHSDSVTGKHGVVYQIHQVAIDAQQSCPDVIETLTIERYERAVSQKSQVGV